MIGYPFFYENDTLDNNEEFMLFSLYPLPENSELNLIQASSLPPVPIVIGANTLKFGDQFCDKISEICGTFQIIPETQTLVLDYNGFCNLVSNSDLIISSLSSELRVTKASAMDQAQNFFQNKSVVVQAGGVQGALYKVGSYFQSAGSAGIVPQTIGLARLAGVNGLQILQAQPYLAVAITTTGAMFFYECGAIAGNNTIGKALITTGDVLALPMKAVEIMWNRYGNAMTRKIFGVPFILNMTTTYKTGPGYTVKEICNYISLNNTSILGSIKERIIKLLS